jgi:enamine deaminase RidA (YjgF/YER057c/UK114 family)
VATSGGGLLHISAIAGLDPITFEFDDTLDMLGQWRQVLLNLRTLVESAGATMRDVAMIRMYVVDVAAYRSTQREIGKLHREFFGGHRPAATLLGVAELGATEALVEIEAVVQLGEDHR